MGSEPTERKGKERRSKNENRENERKKNSKSQIHLRQEAVAVPGDEAPQGVVAGDAEEGVGDVDPGGKRRKFFFEFF